MELQQPPAESRKDEYTGVKLLKSSSSILEDSEKKTADTTSKVIKLNSIYSRLLIYSNSKTFSFRLCKKKLILNLQTFDLVEHIYFCILGIDKPQMLKIEIEIFAA